MPNVSTSFSIRRVLTPSREQVATTVVSACPGRRHRSNNQPGKISSRAQLGDRYVPGPGPDFPLQCPLRIAGRDPVLGAHAIGGAAQRVDLGASTNICTIERNRSDSARSRCSDKNWAGSILWFASSRGAPSSTLSGLVKDHAVTASHHDATLTNGPPTYTTSVDSTPRSDCIGMFIEILAINHKKLDHVDHSEQGHSLNAPP